MATITIGLSQIKVGDAAPSGVMPSSLAKLGKTYENTCKLSQEASEVTEHREEGQAAPEVRKKTKKIPKLTFSIMDCDPEMLAKYIGGKALPVQSSKPNGPKYWGFNGSEVVANKAILVETEQGLNFEIPNGDIEAVIDSDMSAKGIFLVNFTVTPMAVAEGKFALRGVPKPE